MNPVKRKTSWAELLGEKREDMPDKERRSRWEHWKKLAIKAGDQEMVDYWTKDNAEETCSGCVHRDGDWCKSEGLPCSINPVLTFQYSIAGMACMGAGKQVMAVQQTLF